MVPPGGGARPPSFWPLGDARDRYGVGLDELAFAARLAREPELRSLVEGWLAGADGAAWIDWEQRKHERLLAA